MLLKNCLKAGGASRPFLRRCLGSAREGVPTTCPAPPCTPVLPPVGAAVARQVEVGEVGAAAVEQGAQKLWGGDRVRLTGLGGLLGGATRTPSSPPTKVLALRPLRSVCEGPAAPAYLASSSLSFPSVESGSTPTCLAPRG